jgi:hypothetical protein
LRLSSQVAKSRWLSVWKSLLQQQNSHLNPELGNFMAQIFVKMFRNFLAQLG